MRPKLEEQRQARELRSRGWPLRRIAAELGVALSSVSVWVRDISMEAAARADAQSARSTSRPQLSGLVKRCGRCERSLPVEVFNRHPKGRQHWCRECFRRYFAERGDLHRRQSMSAKRRRLTRARALIQAHLAEHGCADCGQSDTDLLEFDHVAAKGADVSELAYQGSSERRLRAEIALCEVVCVNCHRRRTAARASRWRSTGADLAGQALTPGERRNIEWLRALLSRSRCSDCGESDFVVLEFDHLRGKNENIGRMARNGVRHARLRAEVDRCEIVCANCHRKRTRLRLRDARSRRGLPRSAREVEAGPKTKGRDRA